MQNFLRQGGVQTPEIIYPRPTLTYKFRFRKNKTKQNKNKNKTKTKKKKKKKKKRPEIKPCFYVTKMLNFLRQAVGQPIQIIMYTYTFRLKYGIFLKHF